MYLDFDDIPEYDMKTKNAFLLLFLPLFACGQTEKNGPRFFAEVEKNSVRQGEPFQLVYRYENGDKSLTFVPPNWETAGFDVLGSSQMSSMSITNGKVNSSASYSYQVMARDTGLLEIPQAVMRNGSTEIKSEPTQIKVSADPDFVPNEPLRQPKTTEPEPKRVKLKSIRI